MIRIFKLVLLLVVSQVAFGQAPSNYTNINGRYRWIAGMFDSTFHIPKGTSPSLRTGGSTNAGGLFYNTSDSSVYTYTGTQWIKARGSINPSDTTNKYVTQVYKKNGSDSVFYVKGGNHLFAFVDSVGSPGGGGGGKIYYFNGGVNMGTIGGLQMYELGDTANTGAAANFTRSTTGNIANFITDPGKPGLVQIPAGVWSVDAWLSETGGGANHAEIWIEVEKWDGSTITTIATSPIEQITEGSTPNLYSWSVSIPTTSLTVTDRIIIQFYISNTNGKTVTLYTQNGYVGEVHTTFTTGIGAINGLTAPAQYLVTGTSGTDFNINSVTATHIFNLPTASATNRGALSSTDWTTFNSKIGGSGTTNYVSKFTGSGTIGNSQIFDNATSVGIGTAFPSASYKLDVNGNINVSNAVNYSQGGTKYGWTYATSGAMAMEGLQGADISLGTGSGAVATERMVIKNSGIVGIGITPDSMFTVAQGTHLQRGVRMSGLPSAVGTKSLRIDASGTVSIADTLANGVSGTGTINRVSKFTASGAIGNSSIRDSSSSVALDISSQGNLGVGYVPNTWFSSVKTIQLPQGSLYSYSSPSKQLGLGLNYYADAIGTERYMENGFASIYDQVNGTHRWYTAPSGIANNQISFTSRMLLQQTGELVLGNFNSDSMLNVQYGAQFGTGVRMSGLPTAPGTRALRINANGTLSVSDTLANGISGSGTTNYIPKFTSSSAIGNSLVYDNGTNIGVGTTNPTAGRLQINVGDITTAAHFQIVDGTTTLANSFVTNFRNANDGNGRYSLSSWQVQNAVGNDQIGFIGVQSVTGGANYTPNLIFGQKTGASSYTTRMILDASGNLGIGTTNPSNKLTVSNGSDVGYLDFNNQSFILGTSTGSGISLFSSSATGVMTFSTNSILRMTLDASGNLGLAVTPENSAGTWRNFQFGGGNIVFRNGLVNGAFFGTGYIFKTDNSEVYSTNSAVSRIYFDDNNIRFQQAPSGTAGNAISFTQAMTLDASGRLGIGTTNPGRKLDVVIADNTTYAGNADNGNSLNLFNTSTTNETFSSIRLGSQGSGSAGIVTLYGVQTADAAGSGYFAIATRNAGTFAERMRITSGGNVGIGTTSPQAELHISGGSEIFRLEAGASNSNYMTFYEGSTRLGYFGRGSGSSFDWYISNEKAASIIFETNANAERMRITSGGEVYIGNNPADQGAYNLQVNGTGVWGAGAYVDGSDSAVKKNIQPLGSSLDLIKQMNPVTFEYQPFYSKDTTTQTGFIAQELQQVLSDKVYKNGIVKEGGQYLGVAYQHLIPLLVKAIQEQQTQIDQLKSQLNNR